MGWFSKKSAPPKQPGRPRPVLPALGSGVIPQYRGSVNLPSHGAVSGIMNISINISEPKTKEERLQDYYDLKERFEKLDAELREEGLLDGQEQTDEFTLGGRL